LASSRRSPAAIWSRAYSSGASSTSDAAAETVDRLARRGREDLGGADADVRAAYDLRYAGQAFELTIPGDARPDPAELRRAFDAEHRERYGYTDDDAELELVTVRVAVALRTAELPAAERASGERREPRTAIFDRDRVEAAVVRGAPPERLEGPAIVELPEATAVVPPGWTCAPSDDGTLVVERS